MIKFDIYAFGVRQATCDTREAAEAEAISLENYVAGIYRGGDSIKFTVHETNVVD